MKENIDLSSIIGILAPIIVAQLILMIIAIVMCVKAEETRGPKVMWILIIIFANLVGPIAFFLFGRRSAS